MKNLPSDYTPDHCAQPALWSALALIDSPRSGVTNSSLNRHGIFNHLQRNPLAAQNPRASLRMKEICSPAERQILRSGIRSRVRATRIGHICACNVLRLPKWLALHLEWRQWGAPCSPGSQESKTIRNLNKSSKQHARPRR